MKRIKLNSRKWTDLICIIVVFLILNYCLLSVLMDKKEPNPHIKIVTGKDMPRILLGGCVRSDIQVTRYEWLGWLTCVKPKNEMISDTLLKTGQWEEENGMALIDMLINYPDAVYIDIGSNIGPFVVMAAAYDHSVFAIDPVLKNLAYIRKSLELQDLESKVTLINNPVSDERVTLYPYSPLSDRNQGATIMISKEEAQLKKKEFMGRAVHSVTLEDLFSLIPADKPIILKIDVEGSECKVLTNYLNSKNKKHLIPYILIEWIWIEQNLEGLCPDLPKLIKGFESSGYLPYSNGPLNQVEKLSLTDRKKWTDVVWVHKNSIL